MQNKLIIPFIIILILVCGGFIIFKMFKPKYTVYFNDKEDIFFLKKSKYHTGETVKINIMLATDTDYSIKVKEEDVKTNIDYNNYEMIFSFTMPNHDVHVLYETHNSMLYQPELDKNVN